jgi:deazaflavin-dependent oxidoreductase (nitroreductase family)
MNQKVVEEFRANGGTAGGMHESMPLLLLHHMGAKSGTAYISPLAYLPDGKRWAVFAANGGRPNHPGWYFNLMAKPETIIEVGTETLQVSVRVATGDERESLVARQKQASPLLGNFEKATDRQIPVLVFERVDV